MSTVAPAVTGRSAGAVGSQVGPARPRVRLLRPPLRSTWRPSFVSICVALMVACLSALLGINIVLTRGAYTEQQLTLKQTALMEQEQVLHERVARASAPEVLSQRARDLGMIPNSSPAFIRMSDGKILGVPTPATLALSPAFSDLSETPLTPEQAAAAAAAANGGVPAVGVDELPAGQVVLPGDAAPVGSDARDAGPDSTSRSSSTPATADGSSGDGALPVGGRSAVSADQPSGAPAEPSTTTSAGDGAQLVGAGQ